ncbi:type II toxin-antitoxin system ParD family antitoxin [Pseudaminobacter soli (ex Li et al. 2025)]|uniref:Type II toxin-antitoxin system ParD family antitoxin n=1 Tax=Pseudaminobacter soli (ex Li et al. 2025) TaxID=1295366 RepID=A0A2P7SGY2_9HYPH|nr:type II toxin-antitoxin system ParD family antitoxin [Mesorhizobium soli]PSJ61591.1 type II toxin-antitoxin system ParD family antitoxin [Mesorhizobium soli]
MNVSLTKELEEYVSSQVRSGHYSSASEVVREALRAHLRENMARDLQARVEQARAEVAADAVTEATPEFFERARDRIRQAPGSKPDR